MKPGLSSEAMNNQYKGVKAWMSSDWNGACDDLAKIDKPMLVIAGTDDIELVPHENSLVLASKVPGAWLVQIKDAGHAIDESISRKSWYDFANIPIYYKTIGDQAGKKNSILILYAT